MVEEKSWLKIVCKDEFEKFRGKYKEVSVNAQEVIKTAKLDDALILKVAPGSSLRVLSAKVLNEDSEETFDNIMKQGVNAF